MRYLLTLGRWRLNLKYAISLERLDDDVPPRRVRVTMERGEALTVEGDDAARLDATWDVLEAMQGGRVPPSRPVITARGDVAPRPADPPAPASGGPAG
jgi:hypothetical protein